MKSADNLFDKHHAEESKYNMRVKQMEFKAMVQPNSAVRDQITKVLLADDHRLIAEAVATLLTTTEEFHVDTVETYDAALDSLKNSGPYGIIMLDLKMPGMAGIGSIRKIVELSSDGYVVLFSANADSYTLGRAVDVGVRGYIPKTMPLKSLVSVLRLIESGQMFIPVSDSDAKKDVPERNGLNDTELHVIRLAADGMTNKQIADDLDQNETAVKMHMRAICKKLAAHNRAHATMIARDLGMIGS